MAINMPIELAIAVVQKLNISPENPISRMGRRPYASDSAPRMGDPTKFATLKVKVTTPNQSA